MMVVGNRLARQDRWLWVAGKRLTTDDNLAFVPSFSHGMRSSAGRVRRGDIKPCPFPGRRPDEVFRLLLTDETDPVADGP